MVAFIGFRALGDRSVKDPKLLEALRSEIQMERIREYLPDLKQAVREFDEESDNGEFSELTNEAHNEIHFLEVLSSRKIVPLSSGKLVIYVRYNWPGEAGSENERYFRVEGSRMTSWYVRSETDYISYLLNRF